MCIQLKIGGILYIYILKIEKKIDSIKVKMILFNVYKLMLLCYIESVLINLSES